MTGVKMPPKPIIIAADTIKTFIEQQEETHSGDRGRTDHWNKFYSSDNIPRFESPFANWISSQLPDAARILDIGCGNGRDSFYFSALGHDVTGIDVSEAAITINTEKTDDEGPDFSCNSLMGYAQANSDLSVDVIYSRFSIHAMTEEEETQTLQAASQLLKKGGAFHIETRSIKDSLARKGELISHAERMEGHYRRFGDAQLLCQKLMDNGFSIENLIEENGLAVFKDEDPIVIRVFARKS